jgi:flagellar protein FlaG
MIIQPANLPPNQAIQPDMRAHGATPVKSVSETPAQAAPQQVTPEALNNAVAAINQAMNDANQALHFSVDTDTHRTVVKMVDTSTGELIRQFPSDATLAISRGIAEFQQGLLLKQKA